MSETRASIVSFDRPRKLRFTLSSVRQFKAAAGMPLWKVRLPDEDGVLRLLDSETLTFIIWAAMLHEEPRLTFEKAEGLLQKYVETKEGDMVELYTAIAAAFRESGIFGSTKKDEEPEGAEEAASPKA